MTRSSAALPDGQFGDGPRDAVARPVCRIHSTRARFAGNSIRAFDERPSRPMPSMSRVTTDPANTFRRLPSAATMSITNLARVLSGVVTAHVEFETTDVAITIKGDPYPLAAGLPGAGRPIASQGCCRRRSGCHSVQTTPTP